ncbi:hypothetical protein Plec18170_000818 [Paecilomyces lecythidis]
MFATNGVTEILGVTPQQLVSKSFYYCIQERCLRDAVCCIESAKANDSIAYLRFWYRNPLQGDTPSSEEDDVQMTEVDHAHGGSNSELDADRALRSDPGTMADPTRRSGTPNTRLQIEVEAVVSCSSDGLVVVLRRARPPIPLNINQTPDRRVYANGLFASPWAADPVFSHSENSDVNAGDPPRAVSAAPTPSSTDYSHSQLLFDTIRDVAVFAWGVIGINRSLEKYKRGTPMGESQPPGSPQVWSRQSSSSQRTEGDSEMNDPRNDIGRNSGSPGYHQQPYREACSCRRSPSGEPHESGMRERCDPAPPWNSAGSPGP